MDGLSIFIAALYVVFTAVLISGTYYLLKFTLIVASVIIAPGHPLWWKLSDRETLVRVLLIAGAAWITVAFTQPAIFNAVLD